MIDRENIIGFVLLGLCCVVGGVLVYSIITGERPTYDGPAWLAWALLILFVGGTIYGLVMSRGRGRGRQWPDPQTGQRPWWDIRRWLRGR